MALNLAGGNGDPPPELLPHHWISCALDLTRLPPLGSKVLYFPQGHFEQWADHLAPPPGGHGPSFLCTVASLDVVTAAHAPYAVVSLTPVPQDDEVPAAAPAVPPTPPPTRFVYNTKGVSSTDVKNLGKDDPWFGLPKSISDGVLPKLLDGHTMQALRMVDIKGSRWHFNRSKAQTRSVYRLHDAWGSFAGDKKASEHDKVFFLRGDDGRMIIELRKRFNTEEAAEQRIAAPPMDLQQEVTEASQGATFTATYYPHKGVGKFFVQQAEVERATDIEWAIGMNVRLRKDELLHTTQPEHSVPPMSGVVRAVTTDATWRSLEIDWDNGLRSAASAWELDVVGDSPPRKKPRTARLFGADLPGSTQNLQA